MCQAGLDVPQTRAALAREVYRLESALPALAVRPEFEKAVRAGQFIVVKGEIGSGKSTQLPQYLADMRGIDGQVGLPAYANIACHGNTTSCVSILHQLSHGFRVWQLVCVFSICLASLDLTACLLSLLVHCKAIFDWHLLCFSLFQAESHKKGSVRQFSAATFQLCL